MRESFHDIFGVSTHCLARVPGRFGSSLIRRAEESDRSHDWLRKRSGAARARLAGHAAAYRSLFPSAPDLPAEVSHRALFRHLEWTYESLASFGGRDFAADWNDSTSLVRAARSSRPVLLVSAHVGNWLATASSCTARLGDVDTVAGVQMRKNWDERIRRRLAEDGVRVHPPGQAYRAFARRLREGGTVLLHLDGTTRGTQHNPSASVGHASVPEGVRAAEFLIRRYDPCVFGVVSRRNAANGFDVEVTPFGESTGGESTGPPPASYLLEYLRAEVQRDPGEWLIFRPDHLGASPLNNDVPLHENEH